MAVAVAAAVAVGGLRKRGTLGDLRGMYGEEDLNEWVAMVALGTRMTTEVAFELVGQ